MKVICAAVASLTLLFESCVFALTQPSVCDTLRDKRQRAVCFESERRGIPVIDCDHPRTAEHVSFCQRISQVPNLPDAAVPGVATEVENARRFCLENVHDPYDGTKISPPPELAMMACSAAAQKLGSAEMNFLLGVTFYFKDNFAVALAQYRFAARQNYPPALNAIGVLYFNGEGVSQDYSRAVAWWQRAAQYESSAAAFNLWAAYKNGQGVSKDDNQALFWLRKSADWGNPAAKLAIQLPEAR